MNQPRAVLAGSGVAIPPVCVDNAMLSRVLETSDDWIQERSGIVTRYYVEPGVGSSELAITACREALDDARVLPAEVDYLVFANMTPDHYFPGSGPIVQERLGLRNVPTLDLRQQCAGFAYGLQVVDGLIRSGIAKTVLLVGADVHSCLMPFTEHTWNVLLGHQDGPVSDEEWAWNNRFRHLVVLFGDAAGAMVFQASTANDGRGILAHRLYADGANKDILYVPGLGSGRRPFVTPEMIRAAETVPVMDGRTVFKLAVTRMPEATGEVLATAGYTTADLDLVVMHQANLRINEAARKALDVPESKVFNNIQRYGNTTSATLPLAFHEARCAGMAPEGALVAFTALGAGLHWGAVLLRV